MPNNGWDAFKSIKARTRLEDGDGRRATVQRRVGGVEHGWVYVTVRFSTSPWLCSCTVLDAGGTLLGHQVRTGGEDPYWDARNEARGAKGLDPVRSPAA